MSDQSDFFKRNATSGDKRPSVAFHEVGATFIGRIASEPRIVTMKNDRGDDIEKLVADVEALAGCTAKAGPEDERVAIVEGETYALWISGASMTRAVLEACRQAGTEGIAEGGVIAIVHNAVGPKPTQPGRKRAKLYVAEYQKPAVGAGLLSKAGAGAGVDESF